jgi:hypothetical protein
VAGTECGTEPESASCGCNCGACCEGICGCDLASVPELEKGHTIL